MEIKTLKWIFNSALCLTYFEIQKYYQNESTSNGVYSRNNLPVKMKEGAYITNLEHINIGTH